MNIFIVSKVSIRSEGREKIGRDTIVFALILSLSSLLTVNPFIASPAACLTLSSSGNSPQTHSHQQLPVRLSVSCLHKQPFVKLLQK